MALLLISLTLLLLIILSMLRFFMSKSNFSLFFISATFLIISSVSLYLFTSQWHGYLNWKNEGEAHYALLAQVESLGGISGMISRLEQRLAANENDAQGWLILAKLYLSTNQKEKYEQALQRAYALNYR